MTAAPTTRPARHGPVSAATWKKEIRFRAKNLSDVIGVRVSGEPVTVTVKIDGELVAFDIDAPAGVVTLHSRSERQLYVRPIERELLGAVRQAGWQRVRGVGELYAVDADGRPLPRGETIGMIRARAKATTSPADQQALRLAPFDLTEKDGVPVFRALPYAERFALLYTVFGGGTLVRPVIGQANIREASSINALWQKHVLEENFEGLVLRSNGAVKVKPIHTLDLVVMAVQPGAGRLRDTVGALVLAFRDWTGRFLEAGKVGTGLTDADRSWWANHVQSVPGVYGKGMASRTRFVAPVHVAEVQVESFNRRSVRGWRWDPERRRYDVDGSHPGAVIQQARYVRRREDKRPTPQDLRLEQVPGWTVEHKEIEVPDRATSPERFRVIIGEFRSDLARFASKLRIPESDREDVIQSTFAKALAAWADGRLTRGERLQPWLFKVLQNAWLDVARTQARRRTKLAELERVGMAKRERSAERVAQATRANPRRRTAATAARRTA